MLGGRHMTFFQTDPSVAWIAAPWQGGPRSSAIVPYLRKHFIVRAPIAKAVLHVSAFGAYEARLNGLRVGDEVLAPGWTDYNKRVYFKTHEVTHLVRQGENALGALLGDGWFCGFMAWENRQTYGKKPWLRACLEITLRDGALMRVVTDKTWKAHVSPILEGDIIMGESYDARLEIPDWDMPGCDDGEANGWQGVRAERTPCPDTLLLPRVGPPVRRMETLKAVSTRTFIDGPGHKGVLFDFGQNFSGRARVRVKAAPGTTLRMRYGEMLQADNTLYVENLRNARATDSYTCKGEAQGGWEEWEPRFTFHGFRHMEIIGLSEHDQVEAEGVVLYSDMAQTGSFACSNPLLNQLQSNILWGQKSNFLEVPTDCPQRDERLGWTGDAQVFVRTAAFNMDVRGFFQKWLQDMRDAQRANGAMPFVAPMPGRFRHIPYDDGGPAWSDAIFVCAMTIYECYGDEDILRDHYAAMALHMDFIARCRTKDFIRSCPEVDPWGGFGDWLALDGSGKLDGGTPKELIGTALYANDAALMERAANVLGHLDDAQYYRCLRASIRDAFARRFITPEGLLHTPTQTGYALGLTLDLFPNPAPAAQALAGLVRANGNRLATGFVGTPCLLQALEKYGHTDLAYTLLEQEEFPSWLFPVKNGATTIWERWNGWHPQKGFQDKAMNSFNHYAYGAVGAWMYQSVAGINPDPLEPGYRHIVFTPNPGGSLQWAQAALQTAHGEISIRWEREAKTGELRIRLSVPEGCRATLYLPPGHLPCGKDAALPFESAPQDNPPLRHRRRLANLGSGEHHFLCAARKKPVEVSC